MCKVAIFTNFRNIESNKETVEWLGNKLLKSEKDGFGFAIQGKSGVYGEKFVGKSTIYETDMFISKKTRPQFSTANVPFIVNVRKSFGEFSKANGGALFHGRTSTNKLGFKNTHPIQKNGWTLIHNGVVTNHGPKYDMITDNDTEHLVQHMSNGGIAELTKNLTGYYAFGAFDPKGNLHVCRDGIAWLYAAKLPTLETWMFATTQEIISEFCEEFSIERSPIEKVKDNVYMVFDTEGNMIKCVDIESRGYDTMSRGLASKSLSYMSDYGSGSSTSTGWGHFNEHMYNDGPSETSTSTTEIVDAADKLNDDYNKYRTEIEQHLDHSYTIFDSNDRQIDLDTFKAMAEMDQDHCTIVRPDGTWLTWSDYDDDKFPSVNGGAY